MPELQPAGVGDDDLVAGRLDVGLAVDDPSDLDVEQVDLAVDGVHARRRGRSGTEVLRSLSSPSTRSTMLPATSHRPSSRQAPPPSGASGRRAAPRRRAGRSGRAQHVELLRAARRARRRRAAASRTSRSATARLRSLSSLELSCTAAARIGAFLSPRLTRESTSCPKYKDGVVDSPCPGAGP